MKRPLVCAAGGWLALVLLGCAHTFRSDRDPVINELSANGAVVVPAPAEATAPGTRDAPLLVASGNPVVIVCQAGDPDEDNLAFVWRGKSMPDEICPPNVLTWTAPSEEGTYALTSIVNDGRGGTTSGVVFVKVQDLGKNHSPTATLVPDKATLAPGAMAQFAAAASDADQGDILTYAFLPTQGGVTVDTSDPTKATYTAPATVGDQTLYLVVGDGRGGFGVATAKITVR